MMPASLHRTRALQHDLPALLRPDAMVVLKYLTLLLLLLLTNSRLALPNLDPQPFTELLNE